MMIMVGALSFKGNAQAYDGYGDAKITYGVSYHDAGKIGIVYTRTYGISDIFSLGAIAGVVFDNRFGELLENPDHLEAAVLFRFNGANLTNTPKLNLHADLSAGIFRISALAGVTYMWSEKTGIDFSLSVPLMNKSLLKTFNENLYPDRSAFAKPYAGLGFVINVL